jgi:flagellar basal-body rod protein FlgB
MAINFDAAFGIHEQALLLRSERAGVLAMNLANADTPNYKARDIDFRAELARLAGGGAEGLRTTRSGHIGGGTESAIPGRAEHLYRMPVQPSLDGNTVDTQVEQAAFLKNALGYQASLRFLSGRVSGLLLAIKGQ